MPAFLNRRAFIVAGSASSLTLPHLTPNAVATEGASTFACCLAAYRSAVKTAERFSRSLEEPAARRYLAVQAALPHHVTAAQDLRVSSAASGMSTADGQMVTTARRWLEEAAGDAEDDDSLANCRELVQAANLRDARREALARRCGLNDIAAERRRLADTCRTAMEKVVEYPVLRLNELIAKIEAVEELGDDIPAATLLADLRRIEKHLDYSASLRPNRPV